MVRLGMVGLGAWGWGVARNFASIPGCELVSCCDVDPRRRDAAVRTWPTVRPVSDLDEMLRLDNVEAVAIAAPAVMHYPLAKRALLADRDVFVEKPFTLSVRHAEELAELAETRGRIIM